MQSLPDPSEPPEDLLPGTRLGRYEVVALLGRGGFGAVYEATHRELKKRVALKVLHREFALHPTVRARFSREAVAASAMRHPHVVDVTDVGVFEGQPYLVMEFLEGETLRARCERDGAMSAEATLDVLLPVLDAIAMAHGQGIVHRDLKPDNIFLARVGPRGAAVPKVLDFGIVKLGGDLPDQKGTLTGSGALLGTPSYMSPEQAENFRDIDGRSDQFSLGAILYECLTGRRAFEGEGMISILHRVATQPVKPPRELRTDLPAALEAVVLRALEKSPAARFESARAMGAALLPFASAKAREEWSEVFVGGPVELAPAAPPARASATPGQLSREVDPQTLHRPDGRPTSGPRWPVVLGATAAIALALAGIDALRSERAVAPVPAVVPRHEETPAPVVVAAAAPVAVAAAAPVVVPTPPVVRVAQRPPTTRRTDVRTGGSDAGSGAAVDAGVRRRVLGPNGSVIED